MSTAISSPLVPRPAPLIKTLAWKDYREQRAIWLAIALLAVILPLIIGAFARGGLAHVHEDMGVVQMIYGCFIALMVAQGIVCGAQLFAGETDVGSLAFLDALSSRRLPIWRTKLLVGSVFTLLQALVIIGMSVILTSGWIETATFVWLAIVGWLALLWGMVGGMLCERVFPAILLSIGLLLANFAVLMVVPLPRELVQIVLAGVPLLLGYRIFCAADFDRVLAGRESQKASRRAPQGWQTLLWLTHRQGRWIVWPGLAVSFIAGYVLQGSLDFLWPLGTLVIGLVCGLASFAPEQTSEQERFLGAQRFPPGQIWVVKTVFWMLAAAGMTGLYFWGIYFQVALAKDMFGSPFRAGLFYPDQNIPLFVVEWVIYGFACGQFAALLARRIVVAGVLAVGLSVLLFILWAPSLIFGGVHAWQILAVPILLLATARLGMWPWFSGQFYSRRHWLLLLGCGLAIALWIGANLWYRAVEIPDVGEPFDLRAFDAELRQAANSKANDLMREGLVAMNQQLYAVGENVGWLLTKPLFPVDSRSMGGRNHNDRDYLSASLDILNEAWPADDKEINRWLDAMFAGEWAQDFRDAANKPLGLIVDPRTFDVEAQLKYRNRGQVLDIHNYERVGRLFAVRAMQMLTQGKDQAALDHLKVSLAFSRQLQHCFPAGFGIGWPAGTVEWSTLRAFDYLVLKAGPNSALLRQALDLLQEHEKKLPDPLDSLKARFLMIGRFPAQLWGDSRLIALLQLAMETPWEAERQSRFVKAAFQGSLRDAALSPKERIERHARDFGLGMTDSNWTVEQWRQLTKRVSAYFRWPGNYEYDSLDYRRKLRLRQLQIALTLYQIDAGHAAAKLDDLVPHYLSKLPLDPVNDEPFNYEVSKGGEVKGDFPSLWGSPKTVRLLPGQGVLWIGEAEERTWYPVPVVKSQEI